MTSNTAIKTQYDINGYVVVPSMFNSDEVALLRNTTNDIIESARGKSQSDAIHDLEDSHDPKGSPRVRRIKDPVQQFGVYDALARNEKLLSVVRTLLGNDVRFHSSKINIKSVEYGAAVEWHQDWVFYPHTNDDLLAVGIAIDPMTMENGCLMMIPGSHRDPIYDHHHRDGYFVGAVQEKNFSLKDAVPITLDAGGISIHHVRTLHGSESNTSDHSRRLLLTQYCAVDAWPLRGITDWDTFNADIVRGEPTNRPRLADIPVLMPYPEGEFGDLSIYEIQKGMEDRLYEVPK